MIQKANLENSSQSYHSGSYINDEQCRFLFTTKFVILFNGVLHKEYKISSLFPCSVRLTIESNPEPTLLTTDSIISNIP